MTIPDEVRAFLTEELRFPVLATINPDGSIQQSVMWFDLEDDTILMNTKRGRFKDRNMRADSRVSLCFEDGARYLTLQGRVTFIDDQERAHADIYRLAVRYDGEEAARASFESAFSKQERVTLIMSVERILTNGLG